MSLLSLLFDDPLIFLVIILAFLVSLSVHEMCHAWAAYLQGDNTAKRLGRLTLNPLAHIDVWGFLALITVGFGWGKPVPFNPYNLRNPRFGPVLVAGAGPFSNLVMGILAAIGLRLLVPALGQDNLLMVFLSYSAYLNFLLCLFNLIPLPPLDGSKALLAFLSKPRYYATRVFLETQGPMLLIALIVIDFVFNVGLFNWLSRAANLLTGTFSGL